MNTLKSLVLRATTAALALFYATPVFAGLSGIGGIPTISGGGGNLRQVILSIINTILGFIGLIAVIVIIIAGIRLIVAGGDEGQRQKARSAIVYAAVGLLVILLASALVNFVVNAIF